MKLKIRIPYGALDVRIILNSINLRWSGIKILETINRYDKSYPNCWNTK